MDLATFKQRLAEAGLHPDDSTLIQMHAALPHLEAMKARVNRRFELTDESAHTFDAGPPS